MEIDESDSKDKDDLSQYRFVHETEIICGMPVPPITDDYVQDYPSMVDRFFTRFYYIKPGKTLDPYLVLFHSNRVCLICLPPEHPLFSTGVASISFDIGNTDRSQNQVKGKGKKGGMVLQADSTLAVAIGKDDVSYRIPSCIRGKLIEVNTGLQDSPELLLSAEEGNGYVAIVLPKPEHCEEIKQSLLSQEQYQARLVELKSNVPESNTAPEPEQIK